ncbi:MAG: phosphate ABC transporter substrate-binding protein [Polyangia bacterium]
MQRLIAKIAVALFIVAAPANAADDTLSYSGSSTIGVGIMQAGAVKAFEAKTGLKFKSVETIGSSKGVKALIEGKATVAGASRALTNEEKAAKVLGYNIGYDAIAVFVHVDNPVKSLSKAQLKGIFTGKTTRWKDVGGADAPIYPNTEMVGHATVQVFRELALDDEPYGKGFKEFDQPLDQIVEVAYDARAICTVSLGLLASVSPELRKKVKPILIDGVEPTERNIRSGAYLVSRPLVLGTMGSPKGDVKRFIDFMLSREGQQIVAHNFVPLKR